MAGIVDAYLNRRMKLSDPAMMNRFACFGSYHEVVEYYGQITEERKAQGQQAAVGDRGQPSFLHPPPVRPT